MGRLVITPLHSPTPEAAIARMIDLVDDVTWEQLTWLLRAVAAQLSETAHERTAHDSHEPCAVVLWRT